MYARVLFFILHLIESKKKVLNYNNFIKLKIYLKNVVTLKIKCVIYCLNLSRKTYSYIDLIIVKWHVLFLIIVCIPKTKSHNLVHGNGLIQNYRFALLIQKHKVEVENITSFKCL